ALFERAESEAGKSRMAAARRELEAQRGAAPRVLRLRPAEEHGRLQRALEQSPETAKKLTLAARKATSYPTRMCFACSRILKNSVSSRLTVDEGDNPRKALHQPSGS